MSRALSFLAPLALAASCCVTAWVVGCSESSKAGLADASGAADASDGACMPVDAGTPDPAQVALGKALVKVEKCTKCHGDTLEGNFDGVASNTGYGQVYPPNLTGDPSTGLGCWTDQQIQTAILDGLDNTNSPLCPPMPHFGDAGLDAAGAESIAQYLRSLPVVMNNVPPSPDCSEPPEGGVDAGTDAGDSGTELDSGRPPDSGHHDSGKPEDAAPDAPDAADAADGRSDSAEVDAADAATLDVADGSDQ